MAIKYGKKKNRQNSIMYTLIATLLICTVFLGMVYYLYEKTKTEAYESLHVQTKQVKDDIILQLTSDRENLATMANFAAKLYKDGDDYSLLFESFKSIGMIENIGILNPDNTFSTKSGTIELSGGISFREEADKGVYISGRIRDLTKDDYELIRSAVPIVVNGETVGILYGAIKPEKLNDRYKKMVDELGAQLFVYEKESGEILIDTVQDEHKNISFLKDRKYNEGTSYEQLVSTDKGFVSFGSAYKHENLHLHYSTIDEFGWMIALGRYDSAVFASTHGVTKILVFVFFAILTIISLYVLILMRNEKMLASVAECASNVRKELLETIGGQNNIQHALIEVCKFAKSRSAVFFDTSGEFYHYIAPSFAEVMLKREEKQYFCAELFRYASEFYNKNNNVVNVMCIKSDKHMLKTNPEFCKFLKEHEINEISLSATINSANHTAILATINSKRGGLVRLLAKKVSACFSMAIYNKNHLKQILHAATTDSLTGTLNRVAYNNDLRVFDEEKALDFSCIYVDVNELHACNNKYGHAAGDEMLVYIANTLKEVFYGHNVYRMGGDEFVVFCQNTDQGTVKKSINVFLQQLEPRNYHVAIGMSYRSQNTGVEEMVREAETRMYESKAEYYQNKEQKGALAVKDKEYLHAKTGIPEIDATLSVLKEKYSGIWRVSFSTDKAKNVLSPAYMNYKEKEDKFSKLFSIYVSDSVSPDYHRAVLSFLNYDALKHQLEEGKTPRVTFKKNDGNFVVLSIYKLSGTENSDESLWVFGKE